MRLLFLLVFQFFLVLGNAQECTLDLGSDNLEMLTKVFQLNEAQVAQVEGWRAQLTVESRLIEDQIKELFNTHPQSSFDEIEAMSKKYKVLQDKLVNISFSFDNKLVQAFNDRQYERYVTLCNEAALEPLIKNPK